MEKLRTAQIKKLCKLSSNEKVDSIERDQKASSRLLGRSIEKMNISELQNVGKESDQITIGPKTLKIVDQSIIKQFGPTAFGIRVNTASHSPERERVQIKNKNKATFQKTLEQNKKLLVSKNELISSLNAHGNSIKPSITTKALEANFSLSDKKNVPGWL